MASSLPPVPPSPGVGARRKGPRTLPKLPLSVFTPPTTGTADSFPLPPSPSAIHPQRIIDAHVLAPGGDLSQWPKEVFGDKLEGVVVSLHGTEASDVAKAVESLRSNTAQPPVLAILVPFSLDQGLPTDLPPYLEAPSTSGPRIVLSAIYTRLNPKAVEAVRWALDKGFTVDIDIETNLRAGEGAWEDLEEFLTKAIPESPKGKVILSNILPPPDDLTLPIVKLLTHATYNDYQSQTAALSLYANVFIKFIPPNWGAVESFDKKEWKRRIKMYIGPALEAFGYERIVFGSAPSPTSRSIKNTKDWYDLARESWAELGIEQEFMDAVFGDNAKRIYS